MQGEEVLSILKILRDAKGYDVALMTSFNFDIPFFERAILNHLYENNIRKVTLFIDYGQLNKALKETDISSIGYKYMINPIKIAGAFHPKVILLLGETKARLIIGSANIKMSGLTTNNEIFNYIDYDADHLEYLDIINDAIDFFVDINKISFRLDEEVLKQITNRVYYRATNSNKKIFLINNLQKSIINQIRDKIRDEVRTIRIAVPYYDNELKGLSDIEECYPNANVELYIQNRKSTFPIELNETKHIVNRINIFEGFSNQKSGANNFYHGKVLVLETDFKDYACYGSANCTHSAMGKAYVEGGNIECNLMVEGQRHEFQYFFDNLKMISGEKLSTNIMKFENNNISNIIFLYGEVVDRAELHFESKSKDCRFRVFFEDVEVDYKDKNGELLVFIEEDIIFQRRDIFEVEFRYEDHSEYVRCWLINRAILQNNRMQQEKINPLTTYDPNAEGDKFMVDRMNLLKAETTCLSELKEHQRKMMFTNINSAEDDIADEEFIVDVEIPDEYRVYQRQYQVVNKIRKSYFDRFILKHPSIFQIEYSERKATQTLLDHQVRNNKLRKATTEEKNFARFVKNQIRGLIDDKFVRQIEIDHYMGIMEIIFEIFEKYNNKKDKENLFDSRYVLEVKSIYANILLTKEIKCQNSEEIFDSILTFCFEFILELYTLRKKESDVCFQDNINHICSNILIKMDQKYDIRENYPDFLRLYSKSGCKELKGEGFKHVCEYIEKRFGYKTKKLLKAFIENIYEDAKVTIEDGKIIITVHTVNIRTYMRPNTRVLREIKNYADITQEIHVAQIIIRSNLENIENKNHIKTITYYVNLETHLCTEIIERFNGKINEEKAVHINF